MYVIRLLFRYTALERNDEDARSTTWFDDTGSRRSFFNADFRPPAVGARDHHCEMVDEPIARMRMTSYTAYVSLYTSLISDIFRVLLAYNEYEIDETRVTSGKIMDDYFRKQIFILIQFLHICYIFYMFVIL